jgi:hypothetical protein
MSRRLIKEFHPLLLPGLMGVLLAIAPLFCPLLSPDDNGVSGEFMSFVRGLAFFAFVCSVVLVGCLPFGVELQEHTFPLLLSQPMSRGRMWNEKLALVLAAAAGLVLVQFLANQRLVSPWEVNSQDEFNLIVFLAVTISSCGFWTLVARSALGGMAFALASLLLVILGMGYLLERINDGPIPWSALNPAILIAGAIYAAAMLWLGRRRFANFELKGAYFVEGTGGKSPWRGSWWPDWLRCRPAGRIANLIRKELRLQRPVFLIAGLVSLCWLAVLGLVWLAPTHKTVCEDLGNVLTGAFMVLVPLLAGCISLGEEKALGLNSWQLTLPIAPRQQWLVKLAVGAGAALGLGLMLPYALAWMSSPVMETGLAQALRDHNPGEAWLVPLAIAGAPFLLSFWAATALANTVRAALMGIAGLSVLFGCVVLGAWCASKTEGLEGLLLIPLIAQFQFGRDFVQNSLTVMCYSCVVLGVVIVLVQSLAQFKRTQVRFRTTIWYAAAVLAFTVLAAFWVVDLQMSYDKAGSYLRENTAQALRSMGAVGRTHGHSQEVSLADLEQTGLLSGAAKKWLRGANITIQPVEARGFSKLPSNGTPGPVNNPVLALIRFPNGQQDFIGPY